MNIPTIQFDTRIGAKRVTSNYNRETKTRIIAYINDRAVRCYHPTQDKDLFREVTGLNSEGDEPSGFDRRLEHTFDILLRNGSKKDSETTVVGINCLHSRHFSRNFVPAKLEKVTTVRIDFLAGGAIWEVVQRPYRMSATELSALVTKLRAVAATQAEGKHKELGKGDAIDGVGRIEELNEAYMLITPKRKKRAAEQEEEQGLGED